MGSPLCDIHMSFEDLCCTASTYLHGNTEQLVYCELRYNDQNNESYPPVPTMNEWTDLGIQDAEEYAGGASPASLS